MKNGFFHTVFGRDFRGSASKKTNRLPLKDLPLGTRITLKDSLAIDRPFLTDGALHYSLRFPIYTVDGPLDHDARLDVFHCRFDHWFTITQPVIIPAGTSFRVKETRGFAVGDGYVAALRISNPRYPELFAVAAYSARGSSHPITLGELQAVMGTVLQVELLPPSENC